MKRHTGLWMLMMALLLPVQAICAEVGAAAQEYAAEYEQAVSALLAHTPGAVVDYALRERDDGRYEWDLFFTLDGKLGEGEVNEADYSVRRVQLYERPEGGLTAALVVEALMQEKGDLQIADLELDADNGRLRYEGTAVLDGKRYEFDISATGKIIEWERD